MEDVEFNRSHSNSPLPEAGHDPDEPVQPEIDEENSTPNPPITDPQQDMEAAEDKPEMPDQDNLQEAGLSDDESELSEVDEEQFEGEEFEFNAENIAIQERPVDETTLDVIGVHKRKRTEGEVEGEPRRKKKNKREKPRRKKGKDADEVDGDVEVSDKRRKRKEGKIRGATPDEEENENLTPEERRRRALDRAMDEALKKTTGRRRKKGGDIDLDAMADAEIEDMRKRMSAAAEADNNDRANGIPAHNKLKMLPEVVALLNKNTLKENIVDPDTNLLEAVRFFLEPLSDGSLPAYNIQREIFAALAKLPINKDSLVASGIGKVIMFYCKSKRPEPTIKRQAERLFNDWTRPILKRTDDYRKKQFSQAEFDPTKLPVRTAQPVSSQAAQRAKALADPRAWQRARMEAGPTTYTIVPKSNVQVNDQMRKAPGGGDDLLRRLKGRQGGRTR